MDNRPIGFFDSGLGGLTCIPHLMKALPSERIIYFGDTARTPYGSISDFNDSSFFYADCRFPCQGERKDDRNRMQYGQLYLSH